MNEWVLALGLETVHPGPRTLFAQGWVGHLSRILGHLQGNAVTFVAPQDAVATAAGQPTVGQALSLYRLPSLSRRPRIYGVLGNPARHSASPYLHNRVLQEWGEEALYLWLEAPAPEPVLGWIRDGRIAGLSVTAPFKERITGLLDDVEEPVRRLGATNTVWREGDRLRGANTDREAAVSLLQETSADSSMAVLGAGGAARAFLDAASDLGMEATLFNRSRARGVETARELGATWGGDWEELDPARFVVVVNCTPVRDPEDMPGRLASADWAGTTLIDLVYGGPPTSWEGFARRGGAEYHGGLEFLVRQATGQLERWIGRRPARSTLREALPR